MTQANFVYSNFTLNCEQSKISGMDVVRFVRGGSGDYHHPPKNIFSLQRTSSNLKLFMYIIIFLCEGLGSNKILIISH